MSDFIVQIRGVEYEVTVASDGSVSVNGQPGEIDIRPIGENTFSVLIDNVSTQITARGGGNHYDVLLGNNQVDAYVESTRDRLLKKYVTSSPGASRRYEIHAPMPALVVRVEVAEGDSVKEGQGLIVLEAMKMENEIKAYQNGRVKEVYVIKGKPVEKGELLMLLE